MLESVFLHSVVVFSLDKGRERYDRGVESGCQVCFESTVSGLVWVVQISLGKSDLPHIVTTLIAPLSHFYMVACR